MRAAIGPCPWPCILAAAWLSACTPLQWQHPQYGTSRTEADLAACDHAAIQESNRVIVSEPTFVVPHVVTLPNGQRLVEPGPQFAYQPSSNLSELRSFCMRSKGYELVPVPG